MGVREGPQRLPEGSAAHLYWATYSDEVDRASTTVGVEHGAVRDHLSELVDSVEQHHEPTIETCTAQPDRQ